MFDKYGNFTGTFPVECVNDCTRPGERFEDVDYWRRRLNFEVPRDLAVRYLREFGAWDDLDTADDDTLANRVLWTAANDVKDNGEWFGLVH